MAFKFVAFAALLAYANAGLVGSPAVAYSDATAVSSSYFHQATAPVVAKVAAAPIATYAAAPAIAKVATYAAPAVHTTYGAPAVHTTYGAPAVHTYAAPAVQTYAAPAITKTYAAPVAIHDPHYGATHQSVYRSLGGDSAVSHYSKAVDSAFSSVRKYDTRITNDAHTLVAASPVVSTYAAHAPVITKTHYSAPLVSTYAAPAPVVAHAAPVLTKTYHTSPVVSTYAAHAPVITKSYSAPVVSTYAHQAPVVAHAAPVVAKAAISYSPAAVVSHATFTGLGAHYEW